MKDLFGMFVSLKQPRPVRRAIAAKLRETGTKTQGHRTRKAAEAARDAFCAAHGVPVAHVEVSEYIYL